MTSECPRDDTALPPNLGADDPSWKNTPRTVRRLLAAFIVVYVVTFFVLANLKTCYFTDSADDTACYSNMFWSTLHGRPFYSYLVGHCHLADHASFIFWLMLPIYALAPGIATLLLLQTLSLALSGIPFFLLARRWVAPWPALGLTTAFMLHPGIVSQNVNQIHDVQFAIPFILLALYFLEREDFRKFLVCFLLAAIVKETVLPTLALVGVYAALRGRRGKWIWFPPVCAVVLGAGFLLVVSLTVGGWRGAAYFAGYGETPREILHTFVRHPGAVAAEMFRARKMLYVNNLLQPVAWALPLLSPAAILALPDLLTNLISTETALPVIRWHYSLIIATGLCLAAAEGAGRISRWMKTRAALQRTEGLLAGLLLLLTLATVPTWFRLSEYRPTPRHAVIREIIAMVPADASVLAPRQMAPAFSERRTLGTLEIKSPTLKRLWGFDYAIFDGWDRLNSFVPLNREVIMAYDRSPEYRLIFDKAGFHVYKRVAPATAP